MDTLDEVKATAEAAAALSGQTVAQFDAVTTHIGALTTSISTLTQQVSDLQAQVAAGGADAQTVTDIAASLATVNENLAKLQTAETAAAAA